MKLNKLITQIVAFRDARDWKQFHKPNQLATAISIEAAELLEHFLWKSPKEIRAKTANVKSRKAVSEELADILIFSLLLAHELEVDPEKIISQKLKQNAIKYPVAKARGSSAKYTEL